MSRIAAPDRISRQPMDGLPPGHRFSLYLPLWNAQWGIDKGDKLAALEKCCTLGNAAPLLAAVRERQRALADDLPAQVCLVVDAIASSPFATGLGNEHPVENGFAFLTPYGLPYLAGSGVKGVLRRAMEDLRDERMQGVDQALIDALFGPEDGGADGHGPSLRDHERRRGALCCWDVYPEPPEDTQSRLCVDVMTPHHREYYQDQGRPSPHDAGQPNPVYFLALPPRSKLRFVVTHEPASMPDELRGADWRQAVDAAFSRAFDWLGFGAKTAVGYGAMREDPAAVARREREKREAHEQAQAKLAEARRLAELDKLSPTAREIREFLDDRTDRNQGELAALTFALRRGQWQGELKIAIARHVQAEMQRARKWKERSEKKNPLKDHDHQDTLQVMKWLAEQ